jgi:SAM-dependent methyltransferase
MLSPEQEHRRFTQQAAWTQSIRDYVYRQINLQQAKNVLEIGCGEGVILSDLQGAFAGDVYGLDKRVETLKFANQISPKKLLLTCGNALTLPFQTGFFNVTLCHFTLLWLQQPLEAIKEMRRVTRPDGWVVALAEPDYGGRIDYPEALTQVGLAQGQALFHQGADPNLGRKLSGLLHQSGLKEVEVGVLGGQWNRVPSKEEQAGEWLVLEDDIASQLSSGEMAKLRQLDADAWKSGERILYVPTFYGWGRVE